MGEINLLAVGVATAAFFALGALWYGPLFGKKWMALNNFTEEGLRAGQKSGQNPTWLIMTLCFLFQMLVVLVLGHLVAASQPTVHGVMLMAVGLGAAVMAPALGINYLYQMRPGALFAIDAGYFIVGMAAAGAVFVLLG